MHDSGECRGSMVALRTSESELHASIVKVDALSVASVAAVNGSNSVVLSCSTGMVEEILSMLEGVSSRKLDVDHAFHSPLTVCVLDDYRSKLLSVEFKYPSVTMISTVLGEEVYEEVTHAGYWLDHIVRPVRYQRAIETCLELGGKIFVEMGPDSTLTRLSKSIASPITAVRFCWVRN